MSIFTRIPFWLPPVVAVIVMSLYCVLAGGSKVAVHPILMLSLLVAFVAMAVITPVPLLIRYYKGRSYAIPVSLAFLCALVLFGFFMLGGAGETRTGGLLPPFAYRFPLSGRILDMFVSLAGLENIAYQSSAYPVILWTGLFLEIAIVSAIIFMIPSHFSQRKHSP